MPASAPTTHGILFQESPDDCTWKGSPSRVRVCILPQIPLMSGLTRNNFFSTSRKVLSSPVHYLKILPSWGAGCPDGSFAHFQVQARKRGVLGWSLGCFVQVHIPKRVVWLLSKEQPEVLGVVFWEKRNPVWAKWDPFGQFMWNVGKSALELGKRNSIIGTPVVSL